MERTKLVLKPLRGIVELWDELALLVDQDHSEGSPMLVNIPCRAVTTGEETAAPWLLRLAVPMLDPDQQIREDW